MKPQTQAHQQPSLRLVHATSPPRASATVVLHARVVAGRTGGPDKTIFESSACVDPGRYDVHVVYIHPQGDPIVQELEERASQSGCQLHTLAESGAVDMRTVTALRRMCKQLKVDIWHGHDYKTNALGLLLRRIHPMKLVTTAHGWTDDTPRARLYHKLDNFMLPHYDRVMTVSQKLHQQCLQLGVAPERLTYIPNGIAHKDYQPTGQADSMRTYLGVPPGRKVIGQVGRLSPEKGLDRALKTVARLTAMRHDVQLLIVGDGPERNNLLRLSEQLNISDRVLFAGWQKDARPYYEAMDLLLLSSLTEGMPNVVLEAMAMGVPVAATDVGDVSYLLAEGRCGLILSPQADDWALPLGYWLPQEEDLDHLAKLARYRVQTQFSFAERVRRELDVYDQVMGVKDHSQSRRQAA